MADKAPGQTAEQIALHSSMNWVMECYPQVIPVLLRNRMACVGCWMAVFDTVEEAAGYHGLDAATLLAELRAAAGVSPDAPESEAG